MVSGDSIFRGGWEFELEFSHGIHLLLKMGQAKEDQYTFSFTGQTDNSKGTNPTRHGNMSVVLAIAESDAEGSLKVRRLQSFWKT